MAEDEVVIEGTCMAMCPYDELKLREREGLLHSFEYLEGTRINKRPSADVNKTVKEYSRPAAGKQELRAYQLRPAHVLVRTVDYLIDSVLTKTDVGWDSVYHYVFNRLRAVRQDMVIQRIAGLEAVNILEKVVGFHVYAGYRLCEENAGVFDPKINETHTRECLKRLLLLYKYHSIETRRRIELECIYLLYNLGNTEALLHGLSLPSNIRRCKEVQLCFKVTQAYLEGNYIRFHRLVKRLSPLACCAASRHFTAMRRQTLCIMSHGYSSKNLKYPLSKLKDVLKYDTQEQVTSICRSFGVTANDGMVVFIKNTLQENAKISETHSQWIDELLTKQEIPSLLNGSEQL